MIDGINGEQPLWRTTTMENNHYGELPSITIDITTCSENVEISRTHLRVCAHTAEAAADLFKFLLKETEVLRHGN